MFAQISDREPEVGLGYGAEDLRRRPLGLGVFRTEQDSPTPYPILGVPYLETHGDTLAFIPYGGEIVNDSFSYRRDYLTSRLCGHVEPGAGLRKDIRSGHLRNTECVRCRAAPPSHPAPRL